MFDFEEDELYIRAESKWMYVITLSVLIYFDLYWFAIFYGITGISLVVFEESVEEWEYDEFVRDQTATGMHHPTEIRQYSFILTTLLEHTEKVQEQPKFTFKEDKLLKNYIDVIDKLYNKKIIKDRLFFILKENYMVDSLQAVKFDVVNFTKHRIKLSENDIKAYTNAFMQISGVDNKLAMDLIKYKANISIVNDFIANSYIARGVFPNHEYDLDILKYEFINKIEYGYTLVDNISILSIIHKYKITN